MPRLLPHRTPPLTTLWLILPLFLAAGCTGSQSRGEAKADEAMRDEAMRQRSAMGSDIMETLRGTNRNPRSAGNFRNRTYSFATLVAALETAGLSDMLQSSDDRARIGSAKVLQPNVSTANGTIHVIDAVLLPPSMR